MTDASRALVGRRDGDARRALAACAAILADLDGVLTKTASVHAAAWKELFDGFLARHAAGKGGAVTPFDIERDYREYVDGKPRYDGVRSFLASRGLTLPQGDPADPPDRETICGLGNRKNGLFLDRLAREGVAVWPDAVALVRAARARGMKLAVVTSSRNGAAVLDAAGLTAMFDLRVDGQDVERLGLPGKPAPDMFLEAARRLGVEPRRAAVLEDAVAGVAAGHAGGFAVVVGVDRVGQADRLAAHGADLVVSNLEDLVTLLPPRAAPAAGAPHA